MKLLAQYRFSVFRNKLTFSVPMSKDPFYPVLEIHNVRLLDKRLLSKFLKFAKDHSIIESFLRYESTRNLGLLRTKEKRRIIISVNYQNLHLMNSIMMSDRLEIHSGLIFLMQSVSNDVIKDERHLRYLLEGQLAPNLNVLLDYENSFYAFPHYSVVSGGDLNNSWMRRENGIMRVNSLPLGETESYDCFLMASFIRSQSVDTFAEFSKEPVINFGASDDFSNEYNAHKFILDNQERIGSDVIGTLTRDDIFSIQKIAFDSKLDKNESNDDAVCHECHHVDYDSFVDYLIVEKNYVQIKAIFDNLDFLSVYTQDVKAYLIVRLCYLLLHRSINDAQELVDFLIAKSNIERAEAESTISCNSSWGFRTIFTIQDENAAFFKKMEKVMRYFDEEKLMSLEIWVEIHGIFEDDVDCSTDVKTVDTKSVNKLKAGEIE